MSRVLLFAQTFVLMLDELWGLILDECRVCFVNEPATLKEPNTGCIFKIAKQALRRRLFMAQFFTSGMKKPRLNLIIILVCLFIFEGNLFSTLTFLFKKLACPG